MVSIKQTFPAKSASTLQAPSGKIVLNTSVGGRSSFNRPQKAVEESKQFRKGKNEEDDICMQMAMESDEDNEEDEYPDKQEARRRQLPPRM